MTPCLPSSQRFPCRLLRSIGFYPLRMNKCCELTLPLQKIRILLDSWIYKSLNNTLDVGLRDIVPEESNARWLSQISGNDSVTEIQRHIRH